MSYNLAPPPPFSAAAPPRYDDAAYTAPRTQPLAIVGIACSAAGFAVVPVLASIAGIVFGHIALAKIAGGGFGGRSMAAWAIVLGWAGLVLQIAAGVVLGAIIMQAIEALPPDVFEVP